MDPILQAIEQLDIYSRGRFGAWKYEVANQDHSFSQGYECVERLVNRGGPEYEPTLFTPDVVNNRNSRQPSSQQKATTPYPEDGYSKSTMATLARGTRARSTD